MSAADFAKQVFLSSLWGGSFIFLMAMALVLSGSHAPEEHSA